MKNVRLTLSTFVLLFLSSLIFTSCSPDLPLINTTKEIVTKGKWSVNYYFDGQDNTAHFHSFEFAFSSEGTVVCSNGTTSITGTWGTGKDAGGSDALTLHLDTQDPYFTSLNAEWTVNTVNLNNIALKNSNNVQLVFKKL